MEIDMSKFETLAEWTGSVERAHWTISVLTNERTVVLHRKTKFADGRIMDAVLAFDLAEDIDRVIAALQQARRSDTTGSNAAEAEKARMAAEPESGGDPCANPASA